MSPLAEMAENLPFVSIQLKLTLVIYVLPIVRQKVH